MGKCTANPINRPTENTKLSLGHLNLHPPAKWRALFYNHFSMRIFITGFMGAGKSYLGKLLAERLGFTFIDLDKLVETSLALPISDIFQELGEPAFRQIEAERLRSLANRTEIVVATGGGTPCYLENMAWMNENGITIHLDASVSLLAQRLTSGKKQRPLIANLGDEELVDYIGTKLAERSVFYKKSHLQFTVLEAGTNGVEVLAAYLRRFLT